MGIKRQDAHAFGEMKPAQLSVGMNGAICWSTAMKRLRASGCPAAVIAEAEAEKKIAAVCTVHFEIEDPVIGIIGEGANARVGYGCAECSGGAVLEAWRAEREREKRS